MLGIWVLLACIWVLEPSSINGKTNQPDVSCLNVLYGDSGLKSPQLTGWTSNGGDPCGQSWEGITCVDSSVTKIKLSGMGLTGNLGYQMGTMTSLVELDMSNNNLGVNTPLPYNLPPNLQRLNLAGNSFNGAIPYSIMQMTSMEYLNLGHNQFQGSLSYFGQLSNLTTMDLSFNAFAGDLPQSLNSLTSLTTLYLQNNQFTGSINVLANLPLDDLNVGNNRFTGWIPDQLKKINNLQTDGNSWSSGPAPPPPPYMPPPPGRQINPGSGGGGKKSSSIGGGGIAGIIIALLVIGGAMLAFFLTRRKARKTSSEESLDHEQPFTALVSEEVREMKSFQSSSAMSTMALQPSAPISLKPPPTDQQKSCHEDDFSNKPVVKKTKTDPVRATVYSVADLQMATNSFSIDTLVGEGSIGRVYKAQFNDGKVLAIKKISSSVFLNRSPEDFIEVVSNISRLHHPNLTELVGYCSEHGQHLLVYDFHKNGSLHDLLHLSDEYSKPLTWTNRVKIALGTARALEYLHEVCSPSVVHKNFKSANILLDTGLNPHISDCGLTGLVSNKEYQALDHNMSYGYSAPEVAMSGQYTMKSDIYSFGVVMLELITGRKPFDGSRPRLEQSLVRWATPQLHDIDALDRMVDPALEGLYPAKSLSRFADVIALCVQTEPEFRPPMSEVVQALVRLVERANMSKRLVHGNRQEITRGRDDTDVQDYIF